ncbi:MAG: hypothetical protein ACOYL3_13385 [Desulfuromonadaceae bacterium]
MKRLSIRLKEKTTEFFPTSRAGIVWFVMALLLSTPMCAVAAKSGAPGGLDFEIPINELSREQKVPPAKRVASKPQKKKQRVARSRRSAVAAAASTQRTDQAKSVAIAPDSAAPGAATSQKTLLSYETLQPFRIFNAPYSFVVTGKNTVIKAVIYRESDDLQTVSCKIRAAETGALSLVKMAKVDGSRFTYAATLPEVAPDALSLRYTIVAIDVSGTESISPEFASPVTFSPLVPGWQF